MFWFKNDVHVVGDVDFERFKSMAQDMRAKEFKENCPEAKKNFWHIVLAYLERLEESFFIDSFCRGYNRLPLRTTERMFIANFLTSSLKRIGVSNINLLKEIIVSCAQYCDLHYIRSDNRVQEFISGRALMFYIYDLFLSDSFDEIVYYEHELVDTNFFAYYSMDAAIESANEDFTNCLSKFGSFSRKKMYACGAFVERLVKLFVIIWMRINGDTLDERVYREASGSLAMEFLSFITQKHPEFPEKRPKRHIFFILKSIKAILLELDNDPTAQRYLNCVNSFYRIIPEPYAPHADVRDVLSFLLKHSDQREEIIEKYLTTYTKLFGIQSETPYAPRKLKHLCRCFIRNKIIKKSETLEMSVNHLHLPNYLKCLLLGEV